MKMMVMKIRTLRKQESDLLLERSKWTKERSSSQREKARLDTFDGM